MVEYAAEWEAATAPLLCQSRSRATHVPSHRAHQPAFEQIGVTGGLGCRGNVRGWRKTGEPQGLCDCGSRMFPVTQILRNLR